MARSLLDLAASAKRTADALPKAQHRALSSTALFVTNEIRSSIRKATGDGRLSGVGRRGARVGAKYRIVGDVAYVNAVGPLHLIERGTSPHVILPRGRTKTARGRTRRGAKALKFRSGEFYAGAMHPGTKGKKPFERGWKKAAPKAPLIFQQEIRKTISREWL